MVFTRVKALPNNSKLSKEVKKATKGTPDGASVSFFIFDPAMKSLKAKASRDILESDKKAIREFKNTVREARKELKEG